MGAAEARTTKLEGVIESGWLRQSILYPQVRLLLVQCLQDWARLQLYRGNAKFVEEIKIYDGDCHIVVNVDRVNLVVGNYHLDEKSIIMWCLIQDDGTFRESDDLVSMKMLVQWFF